MRSRGKFFYLSQQFHDCHWTGIDIAGEMLFPFGREKFREHNIDVTLIEGDFYKLTELFLDQKFDVVFSIQTLLTLPYWKRALEQLLAVTRGWLFISSLFTDHDVDAITKLRDYTWPARCQTSHSNVYGLQRFRKFCEARGCREFVSQDFELDIDLQPPELGGAGTYTRTLADGRRLQFTGPIFQLWKFLAIRMGDH